MIEILGMSFISLYRVRRHFIFFMSLLMMMWGGF
jgi:hypothetical protein